MCGFLGFSVFSIVQIMPLAFVGGSDESPEVAGLWKEVWSEGSASEASALKLYMTDILPLLQQGEPATAQSIFSDRANPPLLQGS